MALKVTCPACGKKYSVDESRGGKKLQCRCGQVFRAPVAPTADSNRASPTDPADELALLPPGKDLDVAASSTLEGINPPRTDKQSQARRFPWVILAVALVAGSLALLGNLWLRQNSDERLPHSANKPAATAAQKPQINALGNLYQVAPASLPRTAQVGRFSARGFAYVDWEDAQRSMTGFSYVLRDTGNRGKLIVGLLPLYGYADGPIAGRQSTIAEDGYVVAGLIVRADESVRAMKVVFMRFDGDANQLDPKDSYQSDWIGVRGNEPTVTLAGDGRKVVGVFGDGDRELHSIGLILSGR